MDECMKRQALALAIVFLINLLGMSCTFASATPFEGSWFLTASVGRTQPTTDSTNYVGTGPGWPDDYYKANNTHGSIMGAVSGGYLWNRYDDCDWFPVLSLGGQFTYTGLSKISGTIDQYSLPQFQNYTYSYQFRRRTLLAVGKADIFRFYGFMPYVTAGLGVSFNTTSNYIEQPLSNVTPRISPGFRSTTNDYFSYMAGVGIDYAACDYIWLSLEYNYGNYGFANTADGVATPSMTGFNYSNQSLKNKLKANNLLLSFTYVINNV